MVKGRRGQWGGAIHVSFKYGKKQGKRTVNRENSQQRGTITNTYRYGTDMATTTTGGSKEIKGLRFRLGYQYLFLLVCHSFPFCVTFVSPIYKHLKLRNALECKFDITVICYIYHGTRMTFIFLHSHYFAL
jgi:hypothetical protein